MKSDPPASKTGTTTCPACGNAASGKFCSNCGAALGAMRCPECNATLEAGDRFCHRCGATVGAGAPTAARVERSGSPMPWVVAGIAIAALAILVAVRNYGRPDSASAGAAPLGGGIARTDISSMTPRERAERLFDRVMSYAERGVMDSVQFFAPMAISAYEMVQPMDPDARYDLGRIAEVAGAQAIARAQADTILKENPNHLLGLALASSAARMSDDIASADRFDRRLLAAEPKERQKNLVEYQRHSGDIDAALDRARRGTKSAGATR